MTLSVEDFLIVVGVCSAIASCAVVVTVYRILNGWRKEICGHITAIQQEVTNFKIKLYTHLNICEDDTK